MAIQIKCFDEEHEADLEEVMNEFLKTVAEERIIDVKFAASHFADGDGQVFSYSAMVVYREG
jgi:hypothetical protein